MARASSRPLRVLLVDDDPDIRAVARLALERLGGFEVEDVGEGEMAIERAAAAAPDLVVLDVMLPGLGGAAVLERLRGLPAPVVMLTARADPAEHRRLRQLGAAEVIVKPFDPIALPGQVREVWERSRA